MRSAVVPIGLTLIIGSLAAETPCDASVSRGDVREITHLIRGVTSKPILLIMSVDEDKPLPGTVVTGRSFQVDLKTGKRNYHYTHTDRVSVYMTYKDRSHVDVYDVRKVAGRWKIEAKKDWFL